MSLNIAVFQLFPRKISLEFLASLEALHSLWGHTDATTIWHLGAVDETVEMPVNMLDGDHKASPRDPFGIYIPPGKMADLSLPFEATVEFKFTVQQPTPTTPNSHNWASAVTFFSDTNETSPAMNSNNTASIADYNFGPDLHDYGSGFIPADDITVTVEEVDPFLSDTLHKNHQSLPQTPHSSAEVYANELSHVLVQADIEESSSEIKSEDHQKVVDRERKRAAILRIESELREAYILSSDVLEQDQICEWESELQRERELEKVVTRRAQVEVRDPEGNPPSTETAGRNQPDDTRKQLFYQSTATFMHWPMLAEVVEYVAFLGSSVIAFVRRAVTWSD